jgi:hypothetical protein
MKSNKKLLLTRETVRVLQDLDLRHVAGGAITDGWTCHLDAHQSQVITPACAPTEFCFVVVGPIEGEANSGSV